MVRTSETGAEKVHWDLTDLYPDHDSLRKDLEDAEKEASNFAARFRGKIGTREPDVFLEAIRAYEALIDRVGRAYTYAYLHWSTNTEDAARGALLQDVRERYSRIHQELLFLEVEWANAEDAFADAVLAHPAAPNVRHYLELVRLRRRHILSEPEERILAEKQVTGRSAWNRYFDEVLGSARYELEGDRVPQQEILARLHDPDREARQQAALSFTEGLEQNVRHLTFIANTILADKASEDRLRGYPHWLASRNLDNEVSDDTVDALIEAVTSRYDVVARYYELKRRLLGFDTLEDFDRYAPIGESDRDYSWEEAREVVLSAYADFHPEMARIAERFFDERWIDAAVSGGKRGGAFSHGAVPSVHPYILVNYSGKIRDVQTLAHELGHGVHQYLSREQGVLQSDTPLTTAETASVFGEMLVFQRLMRQEPDPRNRLAMLANKIDDSIATVYRQVAMNRYEARIHAARRSSGELSIDDFSDLWIETQNDMFQGSVHLGTHYRLWWSYIPHFLHTPGYVYAYAFGELLVLALYALYEEEGPAFADRYLELLSAGGSDWPHVLVGKLGIDLTDASFWQRGIEAIESLVSQAEELSVMHAKPAS